MDIGEKIKEMRESEDYTQKKLLNWSKPLFTQSQIMKMDGILQPVRSCKSSANSSPTTPSG